MKNQSFSSAIAVILIHIIKALKLMPFLSMNLSILLASQSSQLVNELQYSSQILKHLCDFPSSPMLIWVLQQSQCSKIRVAQHQGRRGAHLSENKGEKSECKKFSKKFKKNGFCFNNLWRILQPLSQAVYQPHSQSVSQSVIEPVSQSIGQ